MYVLIFIIWAANPGTPIAIEFSSRETCENARMAIASKSPYQPGGMTATVCVQK